MRLPFRALRLGRRPAATSALPKASIPCHPAQNETAGCFVSHSRARWLRAEPRHLLRRMTGSRHPECWSTEVFAGDRTASSISVQRTGRRPCVRCLVFGNRNRSVHSAIQPDRKWRAGVHIGCRGLANPRLMLSLCRKMPAHADAIAENRHATKSGLGCVLRVEARRHLSSGDAIANVKTAVVSWPAECMNHQSRRRTDNE